MIGSRHADHRRLARAQPPSEDHVTRARKLLADPYDAWGKPDDAAKWR